MAKSRIAAEKEVVEKMIAVYCRGQGHQKGSLCPECLSLLQYARKRLDHCRFGEEKSFCEQCPVHCYGRDMRAKIKAVMRYSGPRMLLYHPLLAVGHLISSAAYRHRKRKELQQRKPGNRGSKQKSVSQQD